MGKETPAPSEAAVPSWKRGFELFNQYPGFSPPEHLSKADRDLYMEVVHAFRKAEIFYDLFGSDVSSERSAEMFLALARELHENREGYEGPRRIVVEEQITAIASAYSLRSERDVHMSGLGDVLSAARRGIEINLNICANRIRQRSLPPVMVEALRLLSASYERRNKH